MAVLIKEEELAFLRIGSPKLNPSIPDGNKKVTHT